MVVVFVKVWHGVGIGVGVVEGLGVGVGVGVGVDVEGTHTPVLVIVSTRHPVGDEPLLLLSAATRKRSLIVCPLTFGPRFAVVVMKPPELPPQAARPPILVLEVSIIAL